MLEHLLPLSDGGPRENETEQVTDLSYDAVSIQLDVFPRGLFELVSRGLIVIFKADNIEKQSLEAFKSSYADIEDAAHVVREPEEIVAYWADSGFAGKVVKVTDEDGLHYFFRREDLERLRPDNLLDRHHAAKLLIVSEEFADEMMRHGLLTPVPYPKDDRENRFLRSDLDALKKKVWVPVTARDAGARLGIGEEGILWLLSLSLFRIRMQDEQGSPLVSEIELEMMADGFK